MKIELQRIFIEDRMMTIYMNVPTTEEEKEEAEEENKRKINYLKEKILKENNENINKNKKKRKLSFNEEDDENDNEEFKTPEKNKKTPDEEITRLLDIIREEDYKESQSKNKKEKSRKKILKICKNNHINPENYIIFLKDYFK